MSDRGDRGAATVWVVVVMAVLCVICGAVLAMGQVIVARHRAGGAADLAALAAADHWTEGRSGACAEAGRVAEAQGVRIVRCGLRGEISDVTAAAGFGPFVTEVRSRAGPAGPIAPTPGAGAVARAGWRADARSARAPRGLSGRPEGPAGRKPEVRAVRAARSAG
ncbi:Rv3654c family TadE-like protein [Streptomyces sp. NPDC055239]